MTRIQILGLEAGADYALQLQAKKGSDKSPWSRTFKIKTEKNDVKPATPTGVIGNFSTSALVIGWDPVTTDVNGKPIDNVRYEVELVGGGFPAKIFSVIDPAFGMSYTDIVATFNAFTFSFDVRIRAQNGLGTLSDWTNVITVTNPPPAPPTNFVATGVVDGVTLTWDRPADDDIIRYDVHVGSAPGFTPTPANRIFSVFPS